MQTQSEKKQKKLKNIKVVYLDYLLDKNYFGNDEPQNNLVFQPTTSTFPSVTGSTETKLSWRSTALSEETNELPLSPGYNLNPKRKWITD